MLREAVLRGGLACLLGGLLGDSMALFGARLLEPDGVARPVCSAFLTFLGLARESLHLRVLAEAGSTGERDSRLPETMLGCTESAWRLKSLVSAGNWQFSLSLAHLVCLLSLLTASKSAWAKWHLPLWAFCLSCWFLKLVTGHHVFARLGSLLGEISGSA